jgi:hypothetical protein
MIAKIAEVAANVAVAQVASESKSVVAAQMIGKPVDMAKSGLSGETANVPNADMTYSPDVPHSYGSDVTAKTTNVTATAKPTNMAAASASPRHRRSDSAGQRRGGREQDDRFTQHHSSFERLCPRDSVKAIHDRSPLKRAAITRLLTSNVSVPGRLP